MRVLSSVRQERAVSFVARASIGPIYADDAHANRVSSAALELCNLIGCHRDDAPDLLDHGFRENLDLDPDLNGGYLSCRDGKTRARARNCAKNQFAQSRVATSSDHSSTRVLTACDSLPPDDPGDKRPRLRDLKQIFIELNGNLVADRRVAVTILHSAKSGLEPCEQAVGQLSAGSTPGRATFHVHCRTCRPDLPRAQRVLFKPAHRGANVAGLKFVRYRIAPCIDGRDRR